jgi:hypothetical protein
MFFALVGQGLVVALGAMAAWSIWGLQYGTFMYGGAASMANAGLLAWRWHKGLRDFHCDGRRHLKVFHRSFLERFIVVVLLLVAGFAYGLTKPGFQPLAMLIGFVVGQLAWVIAAAALKTE